MPLEEWCAKAMVLVLRDGILPQFTDAQLDVTRLGLLRNDPALIRGGTTRPPYIRGLHRGTEQINGGCLAVYAAWRLGAVATIEEAETYLKEVCHRSDRATGCCGDATCFTTAYDAPGCREEVFRLCLHAVTAEQARRRQANADAAEAAVAAHYCEHGNPVG